MSSNNVATPNSKDAPSDLGSASYDGLLRTYYGDLPESYIASAANLMQVIIRRMACYEQFAKLHGLSTNSLFVLMTLYYAQEPCTQKVISELMWLPKQTVGSIVTGYKKKGYVQEEVSPADRRAKALSLTEEGRRFCDGIFTDLRRLEAAAIMAIDADGINAAVASMDAYTEAFADGMRALEERGGASS